MPSLGVVILFLKALFTWKFIIVLIIIFLILTLPLNIDLDFTFLEGIQGFPEDASILEIEEIEKKEKCKDFCPIYRFSPEI